MNLRLSDGRVAAGRYRTIVARGHTVIDPGVVFDTLVVAGVVAMVGCRGGTVECRAGRMVCTGNMDVRDIIGYGEIHVSGRLSCQTLRFVGVVRADGRLVCARGCCRRRHPEQRQGHLGPRRSRCTACLRARMSGPIR